MGFDLTKREITIALEAKQAGKTFRLIHRLNEPSAAQWKRYQADVNRYRTGGRSVEIQDCTLSAREKLWNEIAVSVEGYDEGDRPLDCSGENWKRLIPILHKSEAVRRLGDVWALGDEDEKNSATASEE